MRYLRIIVIAIVLAITSACFDNLEFETPNIGNSEAITVIGRVTRFDDYDVETRAVKQPEEVAINTYAMAIFPVVEDPQSEIGYKADNENCIYYKSSTGDDLFFNIVRDEIEHTPGQRYAIYVFANMPGMESFSTSTTLDEMLAVAYNVKGIGIPDNGFPMIGTLGDFFSTHIDRDNQVFVMTPEYESGESVPAPTVDGNDMTTLNVPMKALYAKMNFQIEVRPDQIVEGSTYSPQFLLEKYKVVNIPKSVDFKKNTLDEGSNYDVFSTDDITVNAVAVGSNIIDFTFYLPENLLNPEKNASNYGYPFKGTYEEKLDSDQNGIRDEDEKYRQRYKGKLLGADQLAPNIVLTGKFSDHQNHTVDVEYTIHLGKDNYEDFNIVRNGEYNNHITIRGILNSNDNRDNYISLDHRVNVTHGEPAIISLRREVLLDSHFEIRPLRIKYNQKYWAKTENAKADNPPTYVEVEVINADWIRLERSFGEDNANASANNYIDDSNTPESNGKRKYFTEDLVTSDLKSSTKVRVPIPRQSSENQCVWIYIDESPLSEAGDDVRSGTIRLKYLHENGSIYDQIDYTFNQRQLFDVQFEGHSYYIEYFEEYLHNYDSDETYGHTQYEGMKWGLNNIEISSKYPSVYVTKGSWAGVVDYFIDESAGKYDFYLERDNPGGDSEIRENRNGYVFCNEIISSPQVNIGILDLASEPQSAVEYCYNKNKRDKNGNVVDVRWYLPAIDEVEEIMKSKYEADNLEYYTYSRFIDFQNKYYWSSMPAYERSYIDYDVSFWFFSATVYGEFYKDDIDRARATKVDYKGKVIVNDVEVDDFEIPKSGVVAEKYTNTLYIREVKGTFNPTPVVSFTPTDEPGTTGLYYEGEDDSYYEPGNKKRTDMARVRCVRKQ